MSRFSKNQARIAKSLLESSKTIPELRKELDISLSVLEDELKGMIKLKLIEKQGHPTKYNIIEQVRQGFMESKKDDEEFTFKANILVEGQSKERKALEDAQNNLENKLKTDDLIKVNKLNHEEIKEHEGNFSSLFDAEVQTKTFEDMIYLVLNYGPSSVEIIEPKEVTLNMREMQGSLNDVATMVHMYVNYILQLQLEKTQKK